MSPLSLRLPLVFLLACSGGEPGEEDPDPAGGAAAQPLAVEVSVDETIPTVVHLAWSTEVETGAVVSWSQEGGPSGVEEAPQAGPDHALTLVGLKPDGELSVEILAGGPEGERFESGPVTVRTGSLDPALPTMERTLAGDGPQPGMTVVSVVRADGGLGGDGAAVILDADGDIVWFRLLEAGAGSTSSALSVDGRTVLSLSEDGLLRMPLNGDEAVLTEVHDVHHDFTELPDGTVALLAQDVRHVSGRDLRSDAIVELSPGGEVDLSWSAWDHLAELGVSDEELESADNGKDMTHANALDYVASLDAWLITMTNLPGVALVDRSTGELLWSLLADGTGSLALDLDEDFEIIHVAELLEDDRLMLFVNQSSAGPCAHVVELDLGGEAVTEVDRVEPSVGECVTVFALGDVQRLEEGHTLATWSTAGVMEELDADGASVWRLENEFGYAFGYGERVEAVHALW